MENGDIGFVRDQLMRETGRVLDDTVVEDVFHRARYIALDVSEGRRRESQRWLVAKGALYNGRRMSADDPLPTRFEGWN